jgi:hypothetical protein
VPFPPSALTTEAVSTHQALDFEALIRVRVRCHGHRLFIGTRARSPLQVFLLQVLPFLVVQLLYSVAPLMMFRAPPSLSRSPRPVTFSVCSTRKSAFRLRPADLLKVSSLPFEISRIRKS